MFEVNFVHLSLFHWGHIIDAKVMRISIYQSKERVHNTYFLVCSMDSNKKTSWDSQQLISLIPVSMLSVQTCYSHVIAGFNFKLDRASNYTVLERPTLVFQGISAQVVRFNFFLACFNSILYSFLHPLTSATISAETTIVP